MEDTNFMIRYLASLDGYGAKITLKLRGDDDVKNIIGAIISILMLSASLILSFGTFMDYINETNPSITSGIDYGTTNLTFDYQNFFFAISFYKPLENINGIRSAANSSNDYNSIKYINQLNMSCTDCNTEFMPNSLMNLCNDNQFTNLTLKSMSRKKSEGITNIFNTYSFCFPEKMSGTLKDEIGVNTTQESSLQIVIPVSNTSIEFTKVQKNTEKIKDIQKQVSTTNQEVIQYPPAQQPSPPQSQQQPSPQQSQQQPSPPQSQQQPSPQQSQQQPSPPQSQQQPSQQQTQQQPSQQQTQQQPSQQQTQQQPSQLSDNPSIPNRLLLSKSKQKTLLSSKRLQRNLETITLSGESKESYNAILETFQTNKFPKMLIIHRSVEINADHKSDVVKFVHNLEVINYKDPLTGNPIVYDVYVQKYAISIDKGNILGNLVTNSTQLLDFLVVQSIKENTFDSIYNPGAYLSFKLFSDSQAITIKYVNFFDFIGVFGGYYASFSMAAALLAGLYNDLFLKRKMINSIFKIIDNEPDPLSRYKEGKKLKEHFSDQELKEMSSERNFNHFNIQANKVIDGVAVKENLIKIYEKKEEILSLNRPNLQKIEVTNSGMVYLDALKTEMNNRNEEIEGNEVLYQDTCMNLVVKNPEIETYPKVESSFRKRMIQKQTVNTIKDGEIIQDNIEEREIYRKIYKVLVKKKKEKNRVFLSVFDFLCINCCFKTCKRGKMRRFEIIQKCDKIIDKTVEINNLIKKMFEIDLIKKLLLTDRQRALLRFQFRYLNLSNYKETMKFLEIFEHGEKKLDKELFDDITKCDKINPRGIDDKLLDGLKKYYNY